MAASQILHTGGRRWINQILNGSVARPANLYLLLRTLDGAGGHPADAAAADSLTSNLAEVGAVAGYARIAIAFNATNFPESASGADSILSVVQQTFNFNVAGTINGITHAALATTADNTGVLIASFPLGVTRNVVGAAVNGDQLKESPVFTITQG